MLEYALKMERFVSHKLFRLTLKNIIFRSKQLSQISMPGKQDLKQLKEDSSSQKGSVSSSPRSEGMYSATTTRNF